MASLPAPSILPSTSQQTSMSDFKLTVKKKTYLMIVRNRHVDFAMGRVKMLLHFGVTPYLVFDGGYLPSKATEEAERARLAVYSKTLTFGDTNPFFLDGERKVRKLAWSCCGKGRRNRQTSNSRELWM